MLFIDIVGTFIIHIKELHASFIYRYVLKRNAYCRINDFHIYCIFIVISLIFRYSIDIKQKYWFFSSTFLFIKYHTYFLMLIMFPTYIPPLFLSLSLFSLYLFSGNRLTYYFTAPLLDYSLLCDKCSSIN